MKNTILLYLNVFILTSKLVSLLKVPKNSRLKSHRRTENKTNFLNCQSKTGSHNISTSELFFFLKTDENLHVLKEGISLLTSMFNVTGLKPTGKDSQCQWWTISVSDGQSVTLRVYCTAIVLPVFILLYLKTWTARVLETPPSPSSLFSNKVLLLLIFTFLSSWNTKTFMIFWMGGYTYIIIQQYIKYIFINTIYIFLFSRHNRPIALPPCVTLLQYS